MPNLETGLSKEEESSSSASESESEALSGWAMYSGGDPPPANRAMAF